NVPPKYLGTEANKLISGLSASDAQKLDNIPISAILTGSFKNPKISTDIKQAVTSLTNQLIQQQKANLIDKGKTALGNILSGGNQSKDTTKTAEPKTDTKTRATNILKDLLNK